MTCLRAEQGSSPRNMAQSRRRDPLLAPLAFPGCHTSIRRPVRGAAGRGHLPRPRHEDFAAEIERTPENLEFGQLSNAQKRMRTISAEMRRVVDIPDLRTLQQHASDLGREKHFRPMIGRMRHTKVWRNLGDLKRELLDMWTEERNAYAKEVMLDIEKQRRKSEGK